MNTIRLGLKFVQGLSVLGLTAIVSKVANNTMERLLMADVGPAVMMLVRRVIYGVRDFFSGMFTGRTAKIQYVAETADSQVA